jgi:hypothetical protein
MTEMVERVARAILKEAAMLNSPEIQDDLTDGFRLNVSRVWAKRYARAAIEAMREPTEAMLVEVAEPGDMLRTASVWQAMIDAALHEGET